jgi:hypothetical protein
VLLEELDEHEQMRAGASHARQRVERGLADLGSGRLGVAALAREAVAGGGREREQRGIDLRGGPGLGHLDDEVHGLDAVLVERAVQRLDGLDGVIALVGVVGAALGAEDQPAPQRHERADLEHEAAAIGVAGHLGAAERTVGDSGRAARRGRAREVGHGCLRWSGYGWASVVASGATGE